VTSLNVFADPRVALSIDLRARVEETGFRAVLAVPLIVKSTVIGALTVGDRQGRAFQEDEIPIAQAFADQAALALDNARLYDEAQQRLRHLDSLRQVIEQMLVPISLDERLNVIARKAAELFGADRATIALRAADGDELVVRAGHALAAGEVGRVLRLGTGVMGMVAMRRSGVLVNDYRNWAHRDPYIIATHGDRPAEAVIGCPLLIRDQLIGAVSVGVHTPGRRFVTDDLDRLASLAGPAALAIEHSRLYEELQSHVEELESTQEQLVQAGKLSAVGQLVSGVAHELNNPLSVILGYAQLLAQRDLSNDVRRPIDVIFAQGNRMAKIVQSLLLFSRQRKAERGAVDVREAIEQPVSLRATQLLLSGIRLSAVYGEGVPAAEGDAHQLQQVFLNLILNAEQAILGSGAGDERVGDAIRVSTGTRVERGRTWVVVTVADNGPGIRADVLPRIFDPFFTTKNVGEGTGLGLSVSYGIIQQHGGRLSVESEPGRTVFTIDLPAASAASGTPALEGAAPGSVGSGRGRRALVVDDEPGVLELVATLLQQAGWNVETAPGGRIACERLRAADYDLVLADMRMADGSGEDLYRDIARSRQDLAARFLFMTGDTANQEAWRFLDETQAPVIEKPFTAQSLLSAVERVGA
jgi:two-component system NtrC family sensor kinase